MIKRNTGKKWALVHGYYNTFLFFWFCFIVVKGRLFVIALKHRVHASSSYRFLFLVEFVFVLSWVFFRVFNSSKRYVYVNSSTNYQTTLSHSIFHSNSLYTHRKKKQISSARTCVYIRETRTIVVGWLADSEWKINCYKSRAHGSFIFVQTIGSAKNRALEWDKVLLLL